MSQNEIILSLLNMILSLKSIILHIQKVPIFQSINKCVKINQKVKLLNI